MNIVLKMRQACILDLMAMGKFHEKIVSSTTETIFQYIVIMLP